MKETGWEIVHFLRAVYNLFKDTPARRAMFTEITKSTVFPLKFCAVRWLENIKVAQRALDILPNLCNFINEISKTNQLSSTSFETVTRMVKDPFLPAKLQFFISFASDIEPFLKEFQSDVPLAPFLYDAVTCIIKTQMNKVVKPSVLQSVSDIKCIKLHKENLLNSKNIDLGIATKSALRKMTTNPSELQIVQFKDDCRKCILKFISKMLERSPLKHPLTRAISCFDPEVASNLPISKKRMENLLTILLESGYILSSIVDRALNEYKDLCNSEVAVLQKYSRQNERIDHFWNKLLNEKKLHNLFHVMKIVTIFSHGNANVERGFSINKECLVENMKEELLTGRRYVFDHVTSIGGIEKFVVTKGLIQSARNAYSKFKEAQKKKKTAEEASQLEGQRKRAAEREKLELEAKKARILEEAQRQASLLDEQIQSLRE